VIGIAMDVTNEAKVEAVWNLRNLRSDLRLVSALTMLAFVVCHLMAHGFLLISFERAETARNILMYLWRTSIGTTVLVTALIVHYLNALWSIYVRRYLRLARWEWWQLGLGLCIPVLLMLHVVSTRIAESMLGVHGDYSTILIIQWQMSPWLGVLQVAALLTVWIHACIGIHFWLRTKPWYPTWQAFLPASAYCCRPWRSPATSPLAIRYCARPRTRTTPNCRSKIPT
jgi:adenylate cyclase